MIQRLSRSGLVRWPLLALAIGVVALAAAGLVASQPGAPGGTPATSTPAAAPPPAPQSISLWSLFKDSFDLFTVLLVTGPLIAWTVILMCFLEVRRKNIVPDESEQIIRKLAKGGMWSDLREFVAEDDAFVSRVLRSAVGTPVDDKDAVREAAELAASEESARWFRKIEPLNVI